MNIKVGVSNRHVHLTREDVNILFGEGYELTPRNYLDQPGQFATNETVSLKTDKNIKEYVRIVGPIRSYTQVEVLASDKDYFGINPPVRNSKDLSSSETITIIGPKGKITKDNIEISVEKVQFEDDEESCYIAEWKANDTLYRISGRIEKAELKKIIKNMEYYINKKIIEIFVDNKQNNVKRMKSGEVLSRIGDSLLLSRTINELLVNLLPDFIIMIFGIAYMFFLNAHLALIIVGSCILIAIIGWKTFNKIYHNNLKEMQNYADYNANLLETIQSLDEIKTNGSENYYKKRVFSSLKNYADSSADKENYGNYISVLQNLFSIFFGIIVIFLGIKFVIDSKMSMGNLAIFVTISEIIQSVLLEIVLFQFQLEGFLTAYNRILQVFFEKNTSKSNKKMKMNVTNIQLVDFTLSYENKKVIDKTNMILEGKNIFLLGESGCGKSSIAKCLAGLLNVYTGRILVSNGDNQFKDIDKCNVVYLSNESNLFTGTIRENICLGRIVTDKTIERLCKNFSIDDYINNLPNKLEEKIKPNQSNLSTGQKQRIALIRAILSEPDILILDESLSNIDIENRINIVKSLDECNFMKIYISHDSLGIVESSDYYIVNREIVQEVK